MVIKHVHTYIFYEERAGQAWYKCDDPHCHHFAPRKLILNKASICSNCKQNEVILTWQVLRNKRPLCLNCSNSGVAKQYRANKQFIDNLLQRKQETDGNSNEHNLHTEGKVG